MNTEKFGCRFSECQDREVTQEDLKAIQSIYTEVHWKQRRKVQNQCSYWSHPTLTAGLVVKAGGGLRPACIALGHDTVEEGGSEVWDLLQGQVARTVCEGIWALTPPANERHLSWMHRKLLSIERIRSCSDKDVLMVAAADKCATLTEMNWDMDIVGACEVWNRMDAWNKPLVWYYEAMLDALYARVPLILMKIMSKEVSKLRVRQPVEFDLMVGG